MTNAAAIQEAENIQEGEIITAQSVDVTTIEESRDGLLDLSKRLIIRTNDDLLVADDLLQKLAQGETLATEALRPMRESTTKAWKAGTELERRLVGPFTDAKKDLARRRGEAYNTLLAAAEKKRREEEAAARKLLEEKALREAEEKEALAKAAKKKAEEERLEADSLRADGRDAEADEKLESAQANEQVAEVEQAEANAALETPVHVHVPVENFAPAKTAGISSRETWSAKVVNLIDLVKAAAADPDRYLVYLQANETVLNGTARAQKKEMRVPGVVAEVTYGAAVSRKG